MGVQSGYSRGTVGYSRGTAGVHWGTVVVVVDHISLGDPFMFSMNRPIIFCCAILPCNGL